MVTSPAVPVSSHSILGEVFGVPSGYEPRPSSREVQLIQKCTTGRWEMGDISEMGTAVPKRPECVKMPTRV